MRESEKKVFPMIGIFLTTALLTVGMIALMGSLIVAQVNSSGSFSSLFKLDSVHIWWYISRASGLMAYLLVWLSTLWGFAVSSKIFDPLLERVYSYDFHELLSLLSLVFTALHGVVLIFDHVEPFSWGEVFIPFISAYRPFWTGIGIIAFYLMVLVTVTFYIRSLISMRVFRVIHYLSIAAYAGALFHSLYAGTDSSLPWAQWIYWGSFLSTVFFLVYWLVWLKWNKRRNKASIQAQT